MTIIIRPATIDLYASVSVADARRAIATNSLKMLDSALNDLFPRHDRGIALATLPGGVTLYTLPGLIAQAGQSAGLWVVRWDWMRSDGLAATGNLDWRRHMVDPESGRHAETYGAQDYPNRPMLGHQPETRPAWIPGQMGQILMPGCKPAFDLREQDRGLPGGGNKPAQLIDFRGWFGAEWGDIEAIRAVFAAAI